MTTDLAVIQQLHSTPDLPERDRGAAEAVAAAAGLRDAKAGNTRRAYSSACGQFRTWAEAGGAPRTARRPAGRGPLPGPPGLDRPVHRHRPAGPPGHLPLSRRRRDTEGRQPGLHPVVSEAVKGWRNRAPAPRQAASLTADALARVREVLRVPKRGRGGRMESSDSGAPRPPP